MTKTTSKVSGHQNASAATQIGGQMASMPAPNATVGGRWKGELRDIRDYLKEKALDGVLLSLPVGLCRFVPALAQFGDEFTKNLLSLPVMVLVLGVMSMLLYVGCAQKRLGDIARRTARVWFDFTQQFFSLALGAFPVIALLAGTAHFIDNRFESISVLQAVVIELTISLAAFLCGGLWVLREENQKRIRPVMEVAALLGVGTMVFGVVAVCDWYGTTFVFTSSLTDVVKNLAEWKLTALGL